MQGHYPQPFSGYVNNDGFIVKMDYDGDRRIGVTLAKFQDIDAKFKEADKLAGDVIAENDELKAKIGKYEAILIEHKLLEPELTPDEKIAALTSRVDQLVSIVERLLPAQGQNGDTTAQKQNIVVTPEIVSTHGNGGSHAEFVANRGDSKGFIAR